MFKYFVIFATFAQLSYQHPIKNDGKIVFEEEDDNRFSNIIDPEEYLKQNIDKEGYKKYFLNVSYNSIDNRFDGDNESDISLKDESKIRPIFIIDQNQFLEAVNSTEEVSKIKNALEEGSQFQGDMIIPKNQEKYFFGHDSDEDDYAIDEEGEERVVTRTGVKHDKWYKYTNGAVYIPYTYYSKSRFSYEQKNEIRRAMKIIEKYTCIRFTPRSREKDFMLIWSGNDC